MSVFTNIILYSFIFSFLFFFFSFFKYTGIKKCWWMHPYAQRRLNLHLTY